MDDKLRTLDLKVILINDSTHQVRNHGPVVNKTVTTKIIERHAEDISGKRYNLKNIVPTKYLQNIDMLEGDKIKVILYDDSFIALKNLKTESYVFNENSSFIPEGIATFSGLSIKNGLIPRRGITTVSFAMALFFVIPVIGHLLSMILFLKSLSPFDTRFLQDHSAKINLHKKKVRDTSLVLFAISITAFTMGFSVENNLLIFFSHVIFLFGAFTWDTFISDRYDYLKTYHAKVKGLLDN